MNTPSHNSANVERFMGFADVYDAHRPKPPPALADVLAQWAGVDRPALVVDVGSGTGLSTLFWADRSQRVVGVEPSADMRRTAERASASFPNVRYVDGTSTATGLPDASADIVTCSQSLHWMEPAPTFAEISRILRPGGVFCAYDCDWPPTVHWEAERAYEAFMTAAQHLEARHQTARGVHKWDKDGHFARIRDSGQFRYTREITLHHVESGTADRLLGLALSQGMIAGLIKRGLTEPDLGIDRLRAELHRLFNGRTLPWFWSYRLRAAIR
jgi:ubiquinone/menaquinone biosynthesis C-methylase UbiE